MKIQTVKDLIEELNKIDKNTPVRSVRNKKYSEVDIMLDAVYYPDDDFINTLVIR